MLLSSSCGFSWAASRHISLKVSQLQRQGLACQQRLPFSIPGEETLGQPAESGSGERDGMEGARLGAAIVTVSATLLQLCVPDKERQGRMEMAAGRVSLTSPGWTGTEGYVL